MKKLLKLSTQITRQLQKIYYKIRRITKVFLSNKSENKQIEFEFNEHGRDSYGFPNFFKRK